MYEAYILDIDFFTSRQYIDNFLNTVDYDL